MSKPARKPVSSPPKLNLPVQRDLLLARPRLLSTINKHPVSALIAPAGSGKSTLAMQWANAFNGAVCWLSLMPEDDQPRAFWSFALGLIRLTIPSLSDYPALLLAQEGDQVSERFVDALLAELRVLENPLALVVDETHFITHPVLVRSLAHFAAHLPVAVRVVFVGRSLDAVISALAHTLSDLTFTMDETAYYLAEQSKKTPDTTTITRISNATEGWVMGIKLAAIALQGGQSILERTASYSAQYLLDEALRQLPPAQLDFMQRTCIGESLTLDLCVALTHNADSAAMLETLMNAGLFITRISDSPPTYRYHPLFREALLQRDPALRQQAHRLAAAWYAADGLYRVAAEHAYASGDLELTADCIMEASRQSIVDNDPVALLRWMKDFPPELLDEYPRLRLFAILSSANSPAHLALNQAHLAALQAHPKADELRGDIALAEAHLAASSRVDMLAKLEEALNHLPPDSLYAHTLGLMALLCIALNQPQRARHLIEQEYDLAHKIGSKATLLHVLMTRIYFDLADGHFGNVLNLTAEGLGVLEGIRRGLGRWAIDAERTFCYEAAFALMYRGELDAAEHMLLPTFQQIEWIDTTLLGLLYSLRGSIELMRRNQVAAETAFKNAALVHGVDIATTFHLPTQCERMRVLLRFHRVEDAQFWLANVPQGELKWEVAATVAFLTAHARLVIGEVDRALQDLDAIEQDFVQRDQPILVAATQGLKTLAHWLKGDETAARRHLDAVLDSTQSNGNLLPLASVALFPLLRRRITELWDEGEGGDARADHLRRVIRLMGGEVPAMLQSPLTEMEQAVGRLLLDGNNNLEIAEVLALTDRGVRYYMSKLHAKLYTHTRKHLVARLRRLELSS